MIIRLSVMASAILLITKLLMIPDLPYTVVILPVIAPLVLTILIHTAIFIISICAGE